MQDGHCQRTVHAEVNAILQAAKYPVSLVGGMAYVYRKNQPGGSVGTGCCAGCKRLLASTGVKIAGTWDELEGYSLQIVSPGGQLNGMNVSEMVAEFHGVELPELQPITRPISPFVLADEVDEFLSEPARVGRGSPIYRDLFPTKLLKKSEVNNEEPTHSTREEEPEAEETSPPAADDCGAV